MKTNKEHLVMMSVQASVDHPTMSGSGYRVGYDGYGRITMATGVLFITIKSVIAAWESKVITSNRV